MNLFPIVFVVLLILKLAGVIALSWWWVTAPLWILVLLGLALVALALAVGRKVLR